MQIAPLRPPLGWREATPADEPLLESLYAASRDELRDIPGDPAFVQQLLRMQRQAHEAGLRQNYPRALRLVIERGAQPVGHAIVDIGDAELRLLDIAVLPSARRAGIARAVIETLQREAARQNLTMGLTVSRANPAAQALYTKQGFIAGAGDALFVQMHWPADESR